MEYSALRVDSHMVLADTLPLGVISRRSLQDTAATAIVKMAIILFITETSILEC